MNDPRSNPSAPVRLGFVGAGAMGQCAHLRNYASLDECRVVALAEPRAELARRVAERYGIPNVYPDGEAMIATEGLDGIVAPLPFDRHGLVVEPLYRHGLPILTEKPLAASVEMGEKLLASLAAGGSWHMVGYHKRSDPATEWAKAEIDRLKATGELGALRYVRITMPPGDWIAGGFNEMIGTDEAPPASDPDPMPEGMDRATYDQYVSFVNYYIHQVNLMRHLFGEAYTVEHVDPSGVLLVVKSASGVCGIIEMEPYRTTVDWQEKALVTFENGWIEIALPAPVALNRPGRVTVFRDPGRGANPTLTEPQMPWSHAMRNQAVNFVRSVRGEAKPPCEAAEALEDLEIAREVIRMMG
ncbi:Gfo/Idh/MocA family oxidoreductase [bacterium]|nr:MAG: Gfo/Idh/MocA family oxidoreductase [bacterium]